MTVGRPARADSTPSRSSKSGRDTTDGDDAGFRGPAVGTDPDRPASAPTSNTTPHLGQRIRATCALSGTAPFDWHDGQITTLATAPSCRVVRMNVR